MKEVKLTKRESEIIKQYGQALQRMQEQFGIVQEALNSIVTVALEARGETDVNLSQWSVGADATTLQKTEK